MDYFRFKTLKGLKIEYTIENYSKLISCSQLDKKGPKSNVKGIFVLYSRWFYPIFIGMSRSCIKNRLNYYLQAENYGMQFGDDYEFMMKKRSEYKYFAYSEIPIEKIEMVKIALIEKFKPKYNSQFKYISK